MLPRARPCRGPGWRGSLPGAHVVSHTPLPPALHHSDGQAAPGDPGHGRGAAPGRSGVGVGEPGLVSKPVVFLQIQPDLRELMETMHRMSHLPPDFEGRQTVSQW